MGVSGPIDVCRFYRASIKFIDTQLLSCEHVLAALNLRQDVSRQDARWHRPCRVKDDAVDLGLEYGRLTCRLTHDRLRSPNDRVTSQVPDPVARDIHDDEVVWGDRV